MAPQVSPSLCNPRLGSRGVNLNSPICRRGSWGSETGRDLPHITEGERHKPRSYLGLCQHRPSSQKRTWVLVGLDQHHFPLTEAHCGIPSGPQALPLPHLFIPVPTHLRGLGPRSPVSVTSGLEDTGLQGRRRVGSHPGMWVPRVVCWGRCSRRRGFS